MFVSCEDQPTTTTWSWVQETAEQQQEEEVYIPSYLPLSNPTKYNSPTTIKPIQLRKMTKRKQSEAHSSSSSIHSTKSFSSHSSASSSSSIEQAEPNPNLQIIICSCSAHLAPGTFHINPSSPQSYTLAQLTSQYPTLPHLTDLLAAFTPSPLASFINIHATPYLALINPYIPPNLPLTPEAALSRFRDLNLPARVRKYIRNPLLTLGLANRTRIGARNVGVMSFRLCFNIFVVVAWLLIRRFAEIFGFVFLSLSCSRGSKTDDLFRVKLRPLSVESQDTKAYAKENDESTVVVAREGAGWNEVQKCGRERERARKKREAWVEVGRE